MCGQSPGFAGLLGLLYAEPEQGDRDREARPAGHTDAEVDGLHDGKAHKDALVLRAPQHSASSCARTLTGAPGKGRTLQAVRKGSGPNVGLRMERT